MIIKAYKDSVFEIIVQQNDNKICSVAVLQNSKQAAFQGNLDLETAIQIYDFYFDKIMGYDLKEWDGVIE